MVWVPDTEGEQVWIKAEVLSVDADAKDAKIGVVRVKTDSGSERVLSLKTQQLLRCNADTWHAAEGLSGLSDLSVMTHLHEPEVLQALQLRFDIDTIYTFCGPILIALNPFKVIRELYNLKMIKLFAGRVVSPHIYSVAHRAWVNLASLRQSQVVLISGESGAGKTETTKHVLKYLTDRIQNPYEEVEVLPVRSMKTITNGTEKKVLSSNPLLEAFGNACTTRNDNSSRFGKFIELQFDDLSAEAAQNGGQRVQFRCAAIDTYLLEKIRVTELHANERSYHIFYQACSAFQQNGADSGGLPLDLFGAPESFNYLKRSSRFVLKTVDDVEGFESTQDSMDAMGIEHEEQVHMIKVVAAVLHIGNIELKEQGGKVTAVDGKSLDLVCELLGLKKADLVRALTHRLISVSPTEKYDSPLKLKQSEERRESLARAVYALLFNKVVERINGCLAGKGGNHLRMTSLFIGVLDIFGFEHFEHNSFEQLCINFANERLQQLFNQFIFRQEMDLYKEEGITCDFSDFPDNQGIIDLIQAKKMSIFTLLDEECRLPQGSNQSLVQKLWKNFDKHQNFRVEPRKPSSFVVVHFAGPVSYETANFMDKNMDELGELLKQALEESENPFVCGLLSAPVRKDTESKPGARGNAKLKPNTVCEYFKTQLEQLMVKMSSAGPHFVRCIKPNPEKSADRFHRPTVVEQLRSGGVIEALHVQRAGFPCRLRHAACWEDIRILLPRSLLGRLKTLDVRQRLQDALANLTVEFKWSSTPGASYAIGRTTVFFKQSAFEAMQDARLAKRNAEARRIQAISRGRRRRVMYLHLRRATICLQAMARKFLALKHVWDQMEPKARRRSRLFKGEYWRRRLAAEPPVSEDEAEEEREEEQEAGYDLMETAEEEEDPEEARRRWEEEQEEERRRQEEVLQRLREEEERRQREEQLRLEAARLAALEEERRRCEEEWRRERARLEQACAARVRELEAAAEEEREAEAARCREREAEAERQAREAEVRRAEAEQQAALVELRAEQANARVAELEREVRRLQGELAHESARCGEEREAAAAAAALAAQQLEVQRTAFLAQLEELRATLEDAHQQQQDAARAQEAEHLRRFREEVQRLRDREAAQRQRHGEELAEVRTREAERHRKWLSDLATSQKHETDLAVQQHMLEQQLLDARADLDSHRALLEAQHEETKRMHAMQVEMLELRSSERERALAQELELLRKQKDEQVAVLRGHLEFQKKELLLSCQQEVELVRLQSQQRERSLEQLLERAQHSREAQERDAEAQLALRGQQHEEALRCAETKARHVEETARRQQELLEQQLEQLRADLRESQERFRKQLADAQAEHARQLEAYAAEQARREQEVRQLQSKCMCAKRPHPFEEQASLLPQSALLLAKAEQLGRDLAAVTAERDRLQVEKNILMRGTRLPTEGKEGLIPRAFRTMTEDFAVWRRTQKGKRRTHTHAVGASLRGPARTSELLQDDGTSSAPVHRRVKSHQEPQTPMRLLLAPPNLLAPAAGRAPPLQTRQSAWRRATFQDLLGEPPLPPPPLPAADPSSPSSASPTGRVSSLALPPATSVRGSVAAGPPALCPTLFSKGKMLTGMIGVWSEVARPDAGDAAVGDPAITSLCFGQAPPWASHVLLGVGRKNGAVTVLCIRRTGAEQGLSEAEEDEGCSAREGDVEVHLDFKAHQKAVTSMSIAPGGEALATSSTDGALAVWMLADGRLLHRLQDSVIVLAALFLPLPGALVVANAAAVLQLVLDGSRRQKVRLDHYARSLALGLDGERLLAGTSRGMIHAFKVDAQEGLRLVAQQPIGQAALTCIVLTPGTGNMPPLAVVSSMDDTLCVLQANATLTNFTVLRRLPNPHRLLPLHCCHLPCERGGDDSGAPAVGFVASGSEDDVVRIFDLDNFREQRLLGHAGRVVSVAAAPGPSAGLLATGDTHGRLLLWRRGAEQGGSMGQSAG